MPGSVNSTDANNYNHYGGGGLAFTQEYSKPSSTTAATAAAAAVEDGQPLLSHSSPQPTPSLKSPSATSRSSRRRGSEDVNSLRRDLTLVIVKEQVDEESWAQQLDPVLPTYVHLRFTSTKVRLYVATCLAKLTNLKITSAEAPAERGKGAMEVPARVHTYNMCAIQCTKTENVFDVFHVCDAHSVNESIVYLLPFYSSLTLLL